MARPTYALSTTTAMHYDDAVERTKSALKEQGFGILTEIDVTRTLREKLNAQFRPYVILGACNPPLAHRALEADLDIGLLLPCNVVVYDNGDGSSTVEAIDPEAALAIAGDASAAVAQVAHEAKERLQAALKQVGGD